MVVFSSSTLKKTQLLVHVDEKEDRVGLSGGGGGAGGGGGGRWSVLEERGDIRHNVRCMRQSSYVLTFIHTYILYDLYVFPTREQFRRRFFFFFLDCYIYIYCKASIY